MTQEKLKESETLKETYSIDDLIVLKHGKVWGSTDIIQLKDFEDVDLNVDLNRDLWSYSLWKDLPIGESCIYDNFGTMPNFGVIGVYNKRNLSHLSEMINAAQTFYGNNVSY